MLIVIQAEPVDLVNTLAKMVCTSALIAAITPLSFSSAMLICVAIKVATFALIARRFNVELDDSD